MKSSSDLSACIRNGGKSLLAVALLFLLAGLASPLQAQSSTRLTAFEDIDVDGKRVPIVIEEMKVGKIRNIIDYLLIHSRFNFENGHYDLAAPQLQWAASFMDLNAGSGSTVEQEDVRSAAAKLDQLSQKIQSGEEIDPERMYRALFKAHHSMARYHHHRAMMLLDASESDDDGKRFAHPDAIYQDKAGFALEAALVHYDKAATTLAMVKQVQVNPDHQKAVEETYQFTRALRAASGQVDPRKVRSSASTLGQAIDALG